MHIPVKPVCNIDIIDDHCDFFVKKYDFFKFLLKDEVDDQKSELVTLKSKVEDLKEDANKKNEMIGVSLDIIEEIT